MTESNINMRYMRSLIHHLDESVEKLKNILTNKISCVTKFALLRVLLLYSVISHFRYIPKKSPSQSGDINEG